MKLDSRIRRLPIPVPSECRALIDRGALVALSHSGGKDSQAMTILLSQIVPRDRLLVVHAPLGEVEWPGTIEHIQATIPDRASPSSWPPSPPASRCSNASRNAVYVPDSGTALVYLRILRERTYRAGAAPLSQGASPVRRTHRQRHGHARVRKPGPLQTRGLARNVRNSKAGREWFDWLPIHGLETEDVFRIIRRAGQSPHWAYAAGMSRLSCSFCILASRADLGRAAELRPNLYRRYADLEKRIGHTLSPTRVPLPELTGVPVAPCRHGTATIPGDPDPATLDRGP